MIQTQLAEDQSTWGTGGPGTSVDAEFNTIKHNRGIVSMARSQDPNSAGSQFFIVHKDSNFLDGDYTQYLVELLLKKVFKHLIKLQQFKTEPRDIPIDTEQVKIIKAIIVNRTEISNILDLSDPERVLSTPTEPPMQVIKNLKVLNMQLHLVYLKVGYYKNLTKYMKILLT